MVDENFDEMIYVNVRCILAVIRITINAAKSIRTNTLFKFKFKKKNRNQTTMRI